MFKILEFTRVVNFLTFVTQPDGSKRATRVTEQKIVVYIELDPVDTKQN